MLTLLPSQDDLPKKISSKQFYFIVVLSSSGTQELTSPNSELNIALAS